MAHRSGKSLRLAPFIGIVFVLLAIALSVLRRQMDVLSIGLTGLGFLLFLGIFVRVDTARLKQIFAQFSIVVLMGGVLSFSYVLIAPRAPRWDLTQNARHSLSPQTLAILQGLRKPVDIEILATANEPYYSYFRQYANQAPRLTYQIRNPFRDIMSLQGLGETMRVNEIWVRSGERQKRIQFNAEADIRLLEREIASAILTVTQEQDINIYCIRRHGELALADEAGADTSRSMAHFTSLLSERAMRILPLNLERDGAVPANASLVLIAGPLVDYSEREIQALREYLDSGGALLAFIDPPKDSSNRLLRLRSLFMDYGVDVSDSILADYDSYAADRNVFVPVVHEFNPAHPITRNLHGAAEEMPLLLASPVIPREHPPRHLQVTGLFRSSSKSWPVPLPEFLESSRTGRMQVRGGSQWHSYPLAVAVEERTGHNPDGRPAPRIVIVGDADLITDAQLGNVQATFAYFAVNWLTEQDDLIDIPPRFIDATPLLLRPRQKHAIALLTVILIPFTILFGGLGYTSMRRRNR